VSKQKRKPTKKLTGKKYDGGKPDLGLIPSAAELEEGFLWTDGKAKYDAFNWHGGIMYMRILSAMQRHHTLLKAGIDFDYETRRHHAAAIRCGAGMLIQYCLEGRDELDDRIKLTKEAKTRIEKMAQGESIFDILKDLSKGKKNGKR
jgi:hypothetical protein